MFERNMQWEKTSLDAQSSIHLACQHTFLDHLQINERYFPSFPTCCDLTSSASMRLPNFPDKVEAAAQIEERREANGKKSAEQV